MIDADTCFLVSFWEYIAINIVAYLLALQNVNWMIGIYLLSPMFYVGLLGFILLFVILYVVVEVNQKTWIFLISLFNVGYEIGCIYIVLNH